MYYDVNIYLWKSYRENKHFTNIMRFVDHLNKKPLYYDVHFRKPIIYYHEMNSKTNSGNPIRCTTE